MKKIIITLVALFTTAACTPTTTTQNTFPPVTSPPSSQPGSFYSATEEIYIDVIKGEYPYVVAESGADYLIDLGHTICEAIDNGLTLSGLAEIAIQTNTDPGMLGYITGAAIPSFCPRNAWFVNQLGI